MTKLIEQQGQRFGWRGALIFPSEYFDASGSTTSLSLSFNATGSATMDKLFVVVKSLSFTGSGAASLVRSSIFRLTMPSTATGAAALQKLITLTAWAFTATGAATLVRRIGLVRAFTAVGSLSMSDTATFVRAFSAAAVGTAGFVKSVIYGGGGAVRRGVWAIKARLSRML